MAEFYVQRDILGDGTRPVHRDHCAQLPPTPTMIYLGSYASAQAAYTKASNLLSGVVYCPACLQKVAG